MAPKNDTTLNLSLGGRPCLPKVHKVA
jgi:hypothetical protein